MSSPPPIPQPISQSNSRIFRILLRSRWTFVVLQILDLLTTLAAFHYGGFEVNPLVAQLTQHLGGFRGLVASKLIAICIVLRVRRLVWVVNLFYTGIIFWNLIVLIGLSANPQ